MCIHICPLSRSLDIKILHLELYCKFLLHPSMSFSSSVGFYIQPCSKGWDLHHSSWSSRSSCNCVWYPMGPYWACTNPFAHRWFSIDNAQILEVAWSSLLLLLHQLFSVIIITKEVCLALIATSRHDWIPLSERNHKPCFIRGNFNSKWAF